MNTLTLTLAQYLLIAATIACIISMGTVYNGLTLFSLVLLAGVIGIERIKSARTGRPMFH